MSDHVSDEPLVVQYMREEICSFESRLAGIDDEINKLHRQLDDLESRRKQYLDLIEGFQALVAQEEGKRS